MPQKSFLFLLKNFLVRLVRLSLQLRYNWEIIGLDSVLSRGNKRILFLSNHPALIDPVLMFCHLYADFVPRTLADEYQINRPVIRSFARWYGVRTLPNLERGGVAGFTKEILATTIEGLKQGENLLLYPAGHLKRTSLETLGAASAVETILKEVPEIRIVLVRQNGLWGSSFSYGYYPDRTAPKFGRSAFKGFQYLLLNAFFFMPRRKLLYEFLEPSDFPRGADRLEVNHYIEDYFNSGAWKNTYVSYFFWEKEPMRELPEPTCLCMKGDVTKVPQATCQIVFEELERMSGKKQFDDQDQLSSDLGLDSLNIAELVSWIEKEFGFSVGTPDALKSVQDVLLAASGKGISVLKADIKTPAKKWFEDVTSTERLNMPDEETITSAFLEKALKNPGQMIFSDLITGEKKFSEILIGINILAPVIGKLEGSYIGLMTPASVGSVIFYLSCLFGGKIPVMINWTTGIRNLNHSLDLLGVKKVLTAKSLVTKLNSQGISLEALQDRFIFVEDLIGSITWKQKIRAILQYKLARCSHLRSSVVPETAAVLFTSGSESLPKAVPLSHQNILTNIRDMLKLGKFNRSDVLMGMLPPFHSFGLTVTLILPLCLGLRTVFHSNPMESAILAGLIDNFKATILAGTPTFLSGIVRVSRQDQLSSLKFAVTGAEKCPEHLYQALKILCPAMKIVEGYGITECSPVVSMNDFLDPVSYSIGHVLSSIEFVILDMDSNQEVEPGETGMLLVRGPSIFKGYLNYTGDSPFVEWGDKAWYRTGDLVRQNQEGILFFQGRLNRFVKLGGEMISLPAIESVLIPRFTSEKDEGSVIAVEASPDLEHPELILFTVKEADRAQVNEWIRQSGLGPINHIRRIIKLDSIPVLGSGKTDYRALKEKI
ncbi:MAG: AMP-binding protein [Candidatus Aureabacteria bacterium]|nr:AMP-binding protein [Candidatus Auribacterota bacterium]